jgi:hypothetical protein
MARNAVAFEVAASELKHGKPNPAGAYCFYVVAGERVGIEHACPCGCGGLTALWFRGKGPVGRDAWDVAGEWPKVTLSPSIGVKSDGAGNGPFTSPYHWHGYLENGVFVER